MWPRSQTNSESSVCVSLRRMGRDRWSNMFSIQLCCHTWAIGNKQSCLWDREREREKKEAEGAQRKEKRESGQVFMSKPAMNLTCFPDLIYVNSTRSLWDKAFNTSDRNFMPYLLWKYFDGKSHSLFLLNNIPALHRWGFCKADSQIVKFSPAPFIAGNYCKFSYSKNILFHKWELNFSPVIGSCGKTNLLSHACSSFSMAVIFVP